MTHAYIYIYIHIYIYICIQIYKHTYRAQRHQGAIRAAARADGGPTGWKYMLVYDIGLLV